MQVLQRDIVGRRERGDGAEHPGDRPAQIQFGRQDQVARRFESGFAPALGNTRIAQDLGDQIFQGIVARPRQSPIDFVQGLGGRRAGCTPNIRQTSALSGRTFFLLVQYRPEMLVECFFDFAFPADRILVE